LASLVEMCFKIASVPVSELQGNSEGNSVFEIQLYSQNAVLILLLLLGGSVKKVSPLRSQSSIQTLQLYVQTQLP